jgi:antitoxin (DNA-binding transcriptional repressor) of toxin-antitoxin stability system
MKTAAIETETLETLLLQVRNGEELLLTDHSRPFAKLVPVQPLQIKASVEALRRRHEALDSLQKLGGVTGIAEDPAEWQRKIREDRPLPPLD